MTIKIGSVVKTARKSAALKPPPSCHESHWGIPTSRVPRTRLDHCSCPGPSAGRGALFMAGDCLLEWSADVKRGYMIEEPALVKGTPGFWPVERVLVGAFGVLIKSMSLLK
jgi:hypothetical protein